MKAGETIDADTAQVLTEHLQTAMSFMLGFIGKADQVSEPAVVKVADMVIVIGDGVSLDATQTPTATVEGSLEQGYRLINGRLREDVPVSGKAAGGLQSASFFEFVGMGVMASSGVDRDALREIAAVSLKAFEEQAKA